MKYHITNYRGIDIYFKDGTSEQFTFSFDENQYSHRQTMAACKAKIDEYLRNNQNFKEFEVESVYVDGRRRKIVGIRKDGRFVSEVNGNKDQMSEYDEKDWMVVNPDNEQIVKNICQLRDELIKIDKDYERRIVDLKSQLKIKTLLDIKQELRGKSNV